MKPEQMTPQRRLLRKGDTASNNVDEVRESSSAPNFQDLVTVSMRSPAVVKNLYIL